MKYRYIRRDGLEGWTFEPPHPRRMVVIADPMPPLVGSSDLRTRVRDVVRETRMFQHTELRYPENVREDLYVEDGKRELAEPHECVFRDEASRLRDQKQMRLTLNRRARDLIDDALGADTDTIKILKALTAAREALGGTS